MVPTLKRSRSLTELDRARPTPHRRNTIDLLTTLGFSKHALENPLVDSALFDWKMRGVERTIWDVEVRLLELRRKIDLVPGKNICNHSDLADMLYEFIDGTAKNLARYRKTVVRCWRDLRVLPKVPDLLKKEADAFVRIADKTERDVNAFLWRVASCMANRRREKAIRREMRLLTRSHAIAREIHAHRSSPPGAHTHHPRTQHYTFAVGYSPEASP